MKFGQLLKNTCNTLPDIQPLFASYKELKKIIKQLPQNGEQSQLVNSENDNDTVTPQQNKFSIALQRNIEQIEDIALDREEVDVIQLQNICDCCKGELTADQWERLYKRVLNFHGELVLGMHWSVLAYTGICKIIKKYKKKTGVPLHCPQLESLLSERVHSSESLKDLINRTEQLISSMQEQMLKQQQELSHVINKRNKEQQNIEAFVPNLGISVSSEDPTATEDISSANLDTSNENVAVCGKKRSNPTDQQLLNKRKTGEQGILAQVNTKGQQQTSPSEKISVPAICPRNEEGGSTSQTEQSAEAGVCEPNVCGVNCRRIDSSDSVYYKALVALNMWSELKTQASTLSTVSQDVKCRESSLPGTPQHSTC